MDPDARDKELAELKDRVQRLWDEVFPQGGGPSLAKGFAEIRRELADLRTSSVTSIQELDKKINKTIDVLARLQEIAEKGQRGGRTQQAGM
ncbi:hypothetical protein A5765_17780 [Mycolicibacterium celeriflavum]|uniref:Uncharacterized protein n=1 Tax=Mycolicibacterium celeriflavum TaxID=1249101 RepID=A0A1X0BV90_MYCCF|nr:hypothetical protein [Mycolicibacterium celeriflavum]MCV7240575.1 hypothetical protein [Mycolicibacterium celeriflavum]OBG24382.1 hypothetical protein A5765_17780 [Mycolicibacterium celeriflavum]ORA48058.1 hypothetical protein BST21_10575 [Mycolicibacterium celeriflavum]BBY43421.1 hypothetical protein MCEL_17160 [Mycolicibacterium celeriflavum]